MENHKGRSKELIDARNVAVVKRYYYWTEMQRLRYDDTLKVLSQQEFFLSESRIMAILREMNEKIKEIGARPLPKVRKPKITERELELFLK